MSSNFEWGIWILFALENWILDFGRPIAMLVFPLEWFPLNRPSVGDYFHMAYNVITPLCFYKLMQNSSRKFNSMLMNLFLITLVMGASIHLVGDSINHRLSLIGYQYHLSLEDNPIMKELKPKELVKSFDLLYFYDEVLGHYMWYLPYFGCLMLYFQSCFKHEATQSVSEKKNNSINTVKFTIIESILYRLLILLSASYYWYLVTEGQITPLFLFTIGFMLFSLMIHSNSKLDQNGKFLLETFLLTLVFVSIWCYWLWDDKELRKKYTSVLYVPEPWSVYSLHYKHVWNLF